MSRLVLALCLVFPSIASSVAQQPMPGDWVVGDLGQTHNGALFFDPSASPPAPLTTLTIGGQGYINWIRMHPNNTDLLVNYAGIGQFGSLTVPGGVFTSIMAIQDSPNGQALDQDGTILVSTSGGNQLWRIDPLLAVATLLASLPATVNNVCIDLDTGEIQVAIFDMGPVSNGKVLRLSRSGTVLGTRASGLGMTSSVDFDPVSGDFFVTTFTTPEVRKIHRTGTVTRVALFPGANAVKVDQETGNLMVCGMNRTARMNGLGQVLHGENHAHICTGGQFNWSSVEIYGSSKLTGFGPAKPGTRYNLNLNFPASGNRGYAILASLTGMRPGIRLNDNSGRVISLMPDNFFFMVLTLQGLPGIFKYFTGMLNARGYPAGPAPVVDIPGYIPGGLRVYFAAVALNPLMSAGLDVSNPWAFTVQ